MLNARGSASTPVDHFWAASTPTDRAVRTVVLAVAGSFLMWASAKVQVPFYPVPMTMQTAVAFLIGIAYGPRLGAATIVFYLAQGAIGWPVFAGTPEKGVGLPYMFGPTGGYLVGFAVAAAITGWFAERSSHWLSIGLGVLAATVAIYVLGAGWLATMVGLDKAIALGVAPFLLGDLVKLLLVTALAAAGLRTLRRNI